MLAGEVTAVELNPGRARELRDNAALLGATNVHVVEADATALPPELTDFDRALVDAPCSGLGVLAARPDLRWRCPSAARTSSSRCCRRRPRARSPVGPSSTRSARSTRTRTRPWSKPRGSRSSRSARSGRSSPIRSGPEFLLTRPDLHGTSGFFIARLRAS